MNKYEDLIGLMIAVTNLATAIIALTSIKQTKKNSKKSSPKRKK